MHQNEEQAIVLGALIGILNSFKRKNGEIIILRAINKASI
jgi:hypothetical protein